MTNKEREQLIFNLGNTDTEKQKKLGYGFMDCHCLNLQI